MPAVTHADGLLVEAVRRAPGWTTVIGAAAMLNAAGSLLLPTALGNTLDAVLTTAEPGSLPQAVTWLGVVLAVNIVAEMLSMLADTGGSASATARLRRTLLRSSLVLGPAGQRRFGPGDITARLVTGAASGGRVLSALLSILLGLATAAGAIVALALIDWRPAAALLVGAPLGLLAVRLFMRRISSSLSDYQRTQGEITELLVEALAGIRTIRACGTVETEADRVIEPLPRLAESGLRMWRAQRDVAWSLALMAPLLQVAVLAVCGLGVSAGRITAGDLVAALGYVNLALGAFTHLDGLLGLAQARAGAQRVAEVADAADHAEALTESERATALATRPTNGLGSALRPLGIAASLRDVTVLAEDGTRILDRVDLEVPAGRTVAVVGRSGSGKTTLAALFGRLVRPDTGTVSVDGRPVSTMDDLALRAAVAYAFEQPALLGQTVADTIRYGGRTSTSTALVRAATVARADGFIRLLPDGYDTPLDQVPLSGGEAQRLGLARALAQDARLLVLDDATSSLDTATEAEVTAALTEALPGRTRVVVAHRVATAARADLVAWLDEGRLRDVAPHAELWRQPDYRDVFGATG